MCSSDMNLSLDGQTFSMLKEQFDRVLNRTIGNMQMKGAEDATLTLKLSISLEKETRTTPDGVIDATIPKFKHDISSVMQVKDKVSGELVGDYQLVWDDEEQKYIMRKIDNGQTSLFRDDEPNGRFVDADYTVLDDDRKALPGGRRMLSDGSEPSTAGDADENETQELDDAEKSERFDRFDTSTPFGWLHQFVGEAMRVTVAAGNYTVRSSTNRVVLSSATDPSKPFYCDADKLSPHVDHKLVCVGYGVADNAVIAIVCEQCGDPVFVLSAPDATSEDIALAAKILYSSMQDDDDYEYDEPED